MTPLLLNNRYQIIRTLGSGGFGETFLAEDIQMPSRRKCVIKQLKPVSTNPQIQQLVQERFQREAAILEELGDGNKQIPCLYAYFTTEGQFYLVQEWIEGETLTNKVRSQGILRESSVREILINLLPVLDYVHGRGIVHRDIKPDNIILRSRDEKPVLIDFGAVRETMGTLLNTQGETTSSIIIGTPGYMPSEQAIGRPVYSSDLYSLALTAIYLLTGKSPLELETDRGTGEIIWRQYANSTSPNLAAVLDKAIQSHPRDRYSSARQMLAALQSDTASMSDTVPYSPPTLPIAPPNRVPIPETVPPTTPPYNRENGRNSVLLGSAIAGSLIGTSVIVGLLMTKPQSSTEKRVESSFYNTSGSNKSQIYPPASGTQQPQNSTQISSQLNQVVPSYIPSALSPNEAFATCPGNMNLYLVGETPKFKFAVCGANGTPQYYIGASKTDVGRIGLPWADNGFRNENYLYEPPSYHETDYTDAYLRVYKGEEKIVDEKVIQLYKAN